MARKTKNISFSEHEMDIYNFLCECDNASALIKKLVYNYMYGIGNTEIAIETKKSKPKEEPKEALTEEEIKKKELFDKIQF